MVFRVSEAEVAMLDEDKLDNRAIFPSPPKQLPSSACSFICMFRAIFLQYDFNI